MDNNVSLLDQWEDLLKQYPDLKSISSGKYWVCE